jgi:hypothetical protein
MGSGLFDWRHVSSNLLDLVVFLFSAETQLQQARLTKGQDICRPATATPKRKAKRLRDRAPRCVFLFVFLVTYANVVKLVAVAAAVLTLGACVVALVPVGTLTREPLAIAAGVLFLVAVAVYAGLFAKRHHDDPWQPAPAVAAEV